MKSLSKLASIGALVGLNACAPAQPAETSQAAAATTEVRGVVAEALARIGTDREGIQAGPNRNMIYSVACGEGLLEDKTRDDVNLAAMRQLVYYACPNDPKAYVPIQLAGSGKYGQMVCERVMAPRTVVCNGQEKTLSDPE